MPYAVPTLTAAAKKSIDAFAAMMSASRQALKTRKMSTKTPNVLEDTAKRPTVSKNTATVSTKTPNLLEDSGKSSNASPNTVKMSTFFTEVAKTSNASIETSTLDDEYDSEGGDSLRLKTQTTSNCSLS